MASRALSAKALAVVVAYLDDAASDLDAAVRLAVDPPNRHCAFHLQQAAEKLAKAVRLHRALPATINHQIAVLVDELSDDDEWKTRLRALAPLSQFSTTYRYPSPTGRRTPAPATDDLQMWIERITALVEAARADLAHV